MEISIKHLKISIEICCFWRLLEAFGWRFLLNIWRFPLRLNDFAGLWIQISIEI